MEWTRFFRAAGAVVALGASAVFLGASPGRQDEAKRARDGSGPKRWLQEDLMEVGQGFCQAKKHRGGSPVVSAPVWRGETQNQAAVLSRNCGWVDRGTTAWDEMVNVASQAQMLPIQNARSARVHGERKKGDSLAGRSSGAQQANGGATEPRPHSQPLVPLPEAVNEGFGGQFAFPVARSSAAENRGDHVEQYRVTRIGDVWVRHHSAVLMSPSEEAVATLPREVSSVELIDPSPQAIAKLPLGVLFVKLAVEHDGVPPSSRAEDVVAALPKHVRGVVIDRAYGAAVGDLPQQVVILILIDPCVQMVWEAPSHLVRLGLIQPQFEALGILEWRATHESFGIDLVMTSDRAKAVEAWRSQACGDALRDRIDVRLWEAPWSGLGWVDMIRWQDARSLSLMAFNRLRKAR